MKRLLLIASLALALGACETTGSTLAKRTTPVQTPPNKVLSDTTIDGKPCAASNQDDCAWRQATPEDIAIERARPAPAPKVILVPLDAWGRPMTSGYHKPCSDYTGCAPVYSNGSVGPVPSRPAGWNGAGSDLFGPGNFWSFIFQRSGP